MCYAVCSVYMCCVCACMYMCSHIREQMGHHTESPESHPAFLKKHMIIMAAPSSPVSHRDTHNMETTWHMSCACMWSWCGLTTDTQPHMCPSHVPMYTNVHCLHIPLLSCIAHTLVGMQLCVHESFTCRDMWVHTCSHEMCLLL